MWTLGLTVEIKELRFEKNVFFEERFRKLCSLDGFVWTVGLTVEIKELRFEISSLKSVFESSVLQTD